MTQRVPELLTALSETRRLLEEMLLVLEKERSCIIGMDLEGLDTQVARKAEIFGCMGESGARCRELVREVALELELPDAASISPLLARLAEPQREALQGVQRGLLERGATLERRLASNADLLQGVLQTATRSLEFFGRLFNKSSTYGYAGQMMGGAVNRPRIICREA